MKKLAMASMAVFALCAAMVAAGAAFPEEGKMLVGNFALEKCIIEQESEVVDNSFSNELWRIYAFAAREAGVKRLVARDDPRVIFTEHPVPGGARSCATALVVAVNTHDTPVECPVTVDGKVGRVWNGTFRDGVLSIRENDGCVFEVLPPGRSN